MEFYSSQAALSYKAQFVILSTQNHVANLSVKLKKSLDNCLWLIVKPKVSAEATCYCVLSVILQFQHTILMLIADMYTHQTEKTVTLYS